MVTLDLRDLAKYPFLKEAQSYISVQTASLDTFLESPSGRLAVKEALETITNSLRFSARQPPSEIPKIPSEASAVRIIISAYPISRLLVSCSGDRVFIDRLCRYQSWRIFRFLQDENPDKKEIIASSLGISGRTSEIPVIQYVEIVARLQEARWRLVNRVVRKGIVTIYPDEIDEILRERFRVIMSQNLPAKVPPALCTLLEPALERIREVFQERMLEEFGTVEESAFPPCIQGIIHALIGRTHLTHMGRFAVTAFLHNIGMDNTRIVELYGHVPDFDLSKTMYQVEHISGRGGTGTEYIAPLCSTMRTHALCIHPDALCHTIIHPLTYYKQKKRMMSMGKKKEECTQDQSGGGVPDQVPAGADNCNEQKQRDEIRGTSGQENRENKKKDEENYQT
jgi:DNA primase large subunit